MYKDQIFHLFDVIFHAERGEQIGWPVFLHVNGRVPHIQRSCGEQFFHHKSQHFTAAVVYIGLQHPGLVILLFIRLKKHGAQYIGMIEILFTSPHASL